MRYKFVIDCIFDIKKFRWGDVVEIVCCYWDREKGLMATVCYLEDFDVNARPKKVYTLPIEMLKFCAREVPVWTA